MSEPGIIFSAQVQPSMVFPTTTIHGVHPLRVDNREPSGRYARPFPVTDAEYRETQRNDEAHILAIRRGVASIRRWMSQLPAGSYDVFLTVWYLPMNEQGDANFRERRRRAGQVVNPAPSDRAASTPPARCTSARRRRSSLPTRRTRRAGGVATACTNPRRTTRACGLSPAPCLWSLSSPMSRARAEQLEEALLAWRGASLARPVFGAAMRWSPSGVAFWAYPRAWATAEVRVGAGVGESQV